MTVSLLLLSFLLELLITSQEKRQIKSSYLTTSSVECSYSKYIVIIIFASIISFSSAFVLESFKDFKLEISKLFPGVYDTKLLAFEIRRNPVRTFSFTRIKVKYLFLVMTADHTAVAPVYEHYETVKGSLKNCFMEVDLTLVKFLQMYLKDWDFITENV